MQAVSARKERGQGSKMVRVKLPLLPVGEGLFLSVGEGLFDRCCWLRLHLEREVGWHGVKSMAPMVRCIIAYPTLPPCCQAHR